MKTSISFVVGLLGVAACLGADPNESVIRFGSRVKALQAQSLDTMQAEEPPVALAAKTLTRAQFTSVAEWCWVAKTQLDDGNEYTLLDLPGRAAGGAIGSPRLPYYGKFIRVPNGAEVRLVVDEVTRSEIAGRYMVAPEQPPQMLGDNTPRPAFTRNAAAYAQDAWAQDVPIRLADRMRIRGRDFVYVIYTPIAFNPAQKALRAASRVAWHLEYTLPEGGTPSPRPDSVGEAAFASVFERALDGTMPEDHTATAATALQGAVAGADYLILVPDDFAPEVLPLAQLKDRMGLSVRLVPLLSISGNGLWPTAQEITAYIRQAYQTWSPRPTYVLLVGDTDRIPPHNESAWPARPGMPATDLYYAAVDGDDIFPDLFCGRLSCSSAAECRVIVDKIVNHQMSPNPAADYRNSALIPALFQDTWWSEERGTYDANGIEGMRFMESAEALKNFLEAKGMTVFTAYTADSEVVPRRYDPNSYYHEGSHIYFGTQTYLSNAESSARTKQIMGQGVGLVSYHAHGGIGGWDRMNVNDIPALNNGTRLPFVISLTCATGWFDAESMPCFAEALLRRSGGGAVAVIACTRNADQNTIDWTRMGLQEALWPDYFETVTSLPGYTKRWTYGDNYVGRSPRLGQALNFAKMFLFDRMGGSQEGARTHFEIVTLFGDPHMHFQPWNDTRLTATHPASVSAILADFNVSVVNQLGVAVAGAAVTITSTAGDNVSYTTGGSGLAHVSFAPLALDRLTITVVKSGLIPYVGTINLATQPLTVGHNPTTVSAVTGGFVVSVYHNASEALAGATVVASSAAGDNRVMTTDTNGKASFAFVPLSRTTMNYTVSKRGYTTFNGIIQMVPGTLAVNHAPRVDELSTPINVEVRDQGGASVDATVSLTSAGGVSATQKPGPDGIAHLAVQPRADDPLQLVVTARGYTPYESDIPVVAGCFTWDPLPATLDVGGPQPVTIRLKSGIDGSNVITGYTGTATLAAVSLSAPPPKVVIIDVRRYGGQSYVVLESVEASRNTDTIGWQLVTSDSLTDINSASPNVLITDDYMYSLSDAYPYGPGVGGSSQWQAPAQWSGDKPGWVMLLDQQTNVVDLVIWGWDAESISTMAPVIGGRVMDIQKHWNGNGVPSEISNPRLKRIRSANPIDHNTAADFVIEPDKVSYSPIFTVPFLSSGQYLEMTPTETGAFSNGVWQGYATVWELYSNVVFRAEDGLRGGDSEGFDLRQSQHVNYGFNAFSTQQLWNVNFAVSIRALDKYTNTYANFQGQTRLYGFVDALASPVLITECGISASSGNYVEIQNVSGGDAKTAGWRLLLGDSPTNVNSVNPGGVTLTNLRADEVRVFDESPKSTFYWGNSIDWSLGAPGWVMLLDSASNVVDFVAWGWSEADITRMTVEVQRRTLRVGSQWVGNGVATSLRGFHGPLERRGGVDYNRASDFGWSLSGSRGRKNFAMQVPLLDARRPVQVVPALSDSFANGVWTGSVAVREDVDSMYLEAIDQAGRFGDSPRFNVRYLGPITVTVPSLVSEGDGVLTGQGTVSVPGPVPARLTVRLASSDTSEITVPATVTIMKSSSSSPFTITVVNDKIVDFTQHLRIEASAGGCGDGYGSIAVQDDEAATITLSIPATTTEGVGTLINAGDIRLSANVGQDTTFKLTSTDITQLQVPASVTMLTGQNRVQFNIRVIDDAIADSAQKVQITVTPDDVMSETATMIIADNDAHHFEFRPIDPVQTACVPFQVTIKAMDSGGQTVIGYAGRADLTAASGAGAVALNSNLTGLFTSGEWTGNLSVMELGRGVQLAASDGLAQGASTRFDVTHGPLTHFVWTQFPTGVVHAGDWLPARLQACDTNGFPIATFRGPARIEVTQHNPAHLVRLLTFVRYAQLESGHLYARAAIDKHFPHVVETLTTTTNATDLTVELDQHDVFLLITQEDAPAGHLAELGTAWSKALSDFVEGGGVVIACSGYGDEHVLLKHSGLANLMRESVGSDLSPFIALATVATNQLTKGVPARFIGEEVGGYSSADCEPSVRSATNGVGVVMQRALGSGQVVMIGNGFARPGGEFDRILANAVRLGLQRVPRVISSAPNQAGTFVDGVWTGILQVAGAGLDTQIVAEDQTGHRGSIGFFDVAPLSLHRLRFNPSNELTFEWDSAGVTPYTIEYAEGGLDRDFVPLKSGLLATPPTNTYTGNLGNGSSGYYRLSVPAPQP